MSLSYRIEEFNDYCEMDMMGQYVQDVRGVQKRLMEAQVSYDGKGMFVIIVGKNKNTNA